MAHLDRTWSSAFTLWRNVFRRTWWWLLGTAILEEVLSQVLYTLAQLDERLVISGALVALIVQLFLSSIGMIIVNQVADDLLKGRPTRLRESMRENLKPVLVEWTRTILPIIAWGLLFVIPGIVQFIKLYMVPYIAQFDPEYKAGKVDALEKSRVLVQGAFWPLTGILLLTTVLSIVPRFWLTPQELRVAPVLYALAFGLSMVFELYGDLVLFCAYKELSLRHGHSISSVGTPPA